MPQFLCHHICVSVCLSGCRSYLLFLRDPDAPGDADVEDPSDQTEPCSEPPEDVAIPVIRLRVIIQVLQYRKYRGVKIDFGGSVSSRVNSSRVGSVSYYVDSSHMG